MTRIRAVLFDLDDTLYPERTFVESGFRAVAEYLAARHGVESDQASHRMLAILDEQGRGRVFDTLLDELGLAAVQAVPPLLYVYRSHTPDIRLPPESRRVLEELADRGLRRGLVTDGMGSIQRRKLQALGLASHLDVVVVSDELGPEGWKPAALPYRIALDLLGLEPAEAIYVGNDPRKDFLWPNSVGMTTIQVESFGWDSESSSEIPPEARGRWTVGSIEQTLELLDQQICGDPS